MCVSGDLQARGGPTRQRRRGTNPTVAGKTERTAAVPVDCCRLGVCLCPTMRDFRFVIYRGCKILVFFVLYKSCLNHSLFTPYVTPVKLMRSLVGIRETMNKYIRGFTLGMF